MAAGEVLSTDVDYRQGTLTTAAVATDTVLLVDHVVDFDPAGGMLVLGVGEGYGTPIAYTGVTDDEEGDPVSSVLLAAPLGTTAAVGDDVYVWDTSSTAEDKRVFEAVATVLLEDSPKPVNVVVPHEKIPTQGADALLGAQVVIDLDGDEWVIAAVWGRAAVLDASSISSKYLRAFLGSAQSVPTNTLRAISNWETSILDFANRGFQPQRADGAFQIPEAGFYLVVATASWAANSTGARYIIIQREYDFRGSPVLIDLRQVAIPSSLNITASHQASILYGFGEGDWVRIVVQQTSGAALDLVGGSSGQLTGIEIFQAAAT